MNEAKYILCFISISILSLTTLAEELERLWRDNRGRTVKAALILYDQRNNSVKLKRGDGKEVVLPISALSQEDVKYLNNLPTTERVDFKTEAASQDISLSDQEEEPPVLADDPEEYSQNTDSSGGPFGLRMGMTLEEFGEDVESLNKPGLYKLLKVPKPHHAFELYVAQIGPKGGLSWIKAIGGNIETGSSGLDLRVAFEDMRKRLEKTYRAHSTTDYLQSGSIWKESQDWMMALLKKERILSATWDKKSKSYLPNNLKSIYLTVGALRPSSGYLVIEYAFINEDQVELELSTISDEAL